MIPDYLSNQQSFHRAGDEFYTMIGQCITEWAAVDDALFDIFQDCMGPREQSAIIYFRIQSLATRLSLTDEIVMSVLPKPERPKSQGGHDHPSVKAWKTAKGDFDELLSVRSHIAHHPVGIGLEPSGGIMPPKTWYELSASSKERLRERQSDLKPLRVEDLRDHLGKIIALKGRLADFLQNVLTKQP